MMMTDGGLSLHEKRLLIGLFVCLVSRGLKGVAGGQKIFWRQKMTERELLTSRMLTSYERLAGKVWHVVIGQRGM